MSTAAPAQESIRAAVYPVAGNGVGDTDVSEAQTLLEVSLVRQRSDLLRSWEKVRPSCGDARSAPPACLAKLAGRGVVLRSVLRRAPGKGFSLEVSAVDGAARVFGPLQAPIDASLTDARHLVDAIERLAGSIAEDAQVRRAAQSSRLGSTPAPAAAPAAVAPAPGEPVAPRPPPAPAAAVTTRDPGPVGGAWMEPVGIGLVSAGAAGLATGAVFGYLGQRLDGQLTAKYRAHILSPADAASYPTVHRDAVLANSLLITGGALALAGIVLWGLAPETGSNPFALSGHF